MMIMSLLPIEANHLRSEHAGDDSFMIDAQVTRGALEMLVRTSKQQAGWYDLGIARLNPGGWNNEFRLHAGKTI